jgi:ABC-type transport system involved in multi-copper enzyme maturation permease subunit
MKKYLAVIKDSFREALASRVLWVVLVLITLLLLLLAPFSFREELTWRLGDDVNEKVLDVVRKAKGSPSPARLIWSRLDEDLQQRLKALAIPGVDDEQPNPMEFFGAYGEFLRALNKMLEDPDFYDEESFADVRIVSRELRELKSEGFENLSDREIPRFNRLLLEAAFPDLIRTSPATSIQFVYGFWELGGSFPLRQSTLKENMRSRFVFVLSWVVGPVGLFVAVLVTASIIPQMFETGSLHLLLSKPVSRSLLFLSRYFGGCAFVFISAIYLIGGVWLILGVRFNIWDQKLLLSIPIYLFIFAIYYAVSSFAGVYYRSAIVCIALTIVFWGLCFGVGLLKGVLENSYWQRERFTTVIEAQDDVIATNELGIAHRWNATDASWDEVFVSEEQEQIRGILRFMFFTPIVPREFRSIGPVYDPEADCLLGVRPNMQLTALSFYVGPRQSEPQREGSPIEPADQANQDAWAAAPPIDAPMGSFRLLKEQDGKLLVVSSLGLYRLVGDPLEKTEPVEIFGFALPLATGGPFEKVSPVDGLVLARPSDAAMNRKTAELAVYSRGSVMVLKQTERGNYDVRSELELEDSGNKPVLLAFGGNSLMLAHGDGTIQVFNGETLEPHSEFDDEAPNQPRFVRASPDGRWFAIVFHNGNLWLYDAEADAFQRPRITGQGDISGASFSEDGKLFAVDKTFRVSRYALGPTKVEQRYSPRLGLGGVLYRFGLVPAYTLFPKPGRLDETFQYLLSGKETEAADTGDLEAAQEALNPWTPVWSSALFTIVVLVIACVYIEWQEF